MKCIINSLALSLICINISSGQIDSTKLLNDSVHIQKDKIFERWLDDLYKSNVEINGDSIKYNKEAVKILTDSSYYKAMYPKTYNWVTTTFLLDQKALKQAIWYMINLYNTNKSQNGKRVLNSIISLDRAIDMEKVLINTYYSYIAFDPEIVLIENEVVKKIERPDIAEQKLFVTKEIVQNLMEYRKNNIKN